MEHYAQLKLRLNSSAVIDLCMTTDLQLEWFSFNIFEEI